MQSSLSALLYRDTVDFHFICCVQEDHSEELEALKNESEMPLEDLLKSLPAEMFDGSAEDKDGASADQKVKCLYLLSLDYFVSDHDHYSDNTIDTEVCQVI